MDETTFNILAIIALAIMLGIVIFYNPKPKNNEKR